MSSTEHQWQAIADTFKAAADYVMHRDGPGHVTEWLCEQRETALAELKAHSLGQGSLVDPVENAWRRAIAKWNDASSTTDYSTEAPGRIVDELLLLRRGEPGLTRDLMLAVEHMLTITDDTKIPEALRRLAHARDNLGRTMENVKRGSPERPAFTLQIIRNSGGIDSAPLIWAWLLIERDILKDHHDLAVKMLFDAAKGAVEGHDLAEGLDE